MSINISIEEYGLLKNFKDQIEEKKKEFFKLNMKNNRKRTENV